MSVLFGIGPRLSYPPGHTPRMNIEFQHGRWFEEQERAVRFEAPRTKIQDPEKFREPNINMNGRFGRLSGCVRRAGGLPSQGLEIKGKLGGEFPIRLETRNRWKAFCDNRKQEGVADSCRYLQIKKKNAVAESCRSGSAEWESFGGRFRACESGASHRTPRRCRAGEDGMGQSSVRAGMRARSEKGCAKRFKCEGAHILGRSGFIDLQRIAMRAQRYAQVIADILSAKCEVRNGRASEDISGCAKAALCAALHDAVALAGATMAQRAGALSQKRVGGAQGRPLWGKGLGMGFTIMSTFSDK